MRKLYVQLNILINQGSISLNVWELLFSTKYNSLGANLTPKSFSETASRLPNNAKDPNLTNSVYMLEVAKHLEYYILCTTMTMSGIIRIAIVMQLVCLYLDVL